MEISSKLPAADATTDVKADRTGCDGRLFPESRDDRVYLSDRAREFKAAQESLRLMPKVDLAKVAEIRARLKAGRYAIDPQKTAVRMLEDLLLKDLA